MRRRALAAALLLVLGGSLIRIVLTGEYVRYVRESMSLPLLLAGAATAALGFAGWWVATGSRREEPVAVVTAGPSAPAAGEAHAHGHLPAVSWLLLLPVMAVTLVPPPALGSDAVLRDSGLVATPESDLFPELPATDPVVLSPRETVERVMFAPSAGILDRTVAVTGFAVPAVDGEPGWYLARITLTCCAADGVAYRLYVPTGPAPAADTWVSVTGRLSPPSGPVEGTSIPVLTPTAVVPTAAPDNPYD